MGIVKCILYKKGFIEKEALKSHFIDDHSVSKNDDVLNRYVDLRFSVNTGDVAKKQEMLVY